MHYLWAQTLQSRNASHLQLYFPGNRTLKRITGYSQCCKSFWTCFFWHVARFSCIYARYLVSWRHAPPAVQIPKPDSSQNPSVPLKECSRWKKLTQESKRNTSTSHHLVIFRKPSATPQLEWSQYNKISQSLSSWWLGQVTLQASAKSSGKTEQE